MLILPNSLIKKNLTTERDQSMIQQPLYLEMSFEKISSERFDESQRWWKNPFFVNHHPSGFVGPGSSRHDLSSWRTIFWFGDPVIPKMGHRSSSGKMKSCILLLLPFPWLVQVQNNKVIKSWYMIIEDDQLLLRRSHSGRTPVFDGWDDWLKKNED